MYLLPPRPAPAQFSAAAPSVRPSSTSRPLITPEVARALLVPLSLAIPAAGPVSPRSSAVTLSPALCPSPWLGAAAGAERGRAAPRVSARAAWGSPRGSIPPRERGAFLREGEQWLGAAESRTSPSSAFIPSPSRSVPQELCFQLETPCAGGSREGRWCLWSPSPHRWRWGGVCWLPGQWRGWPSTRAPIVRAAGIVTGWEREAAPDGRVAFVSKGCDSDRGVGRQVAGMRASNFSPTRILCSPVTPALSALVARSTWPDYKKSFPWTYCAHVLRINGSVFLLLVMHGSNLTKMLFCSKIPVCILF